MSNPPSVQDFARPKKSTTVAICMVVMALGVVVWYNYYLKVRKQALEEKIKGRLPHKNKVETDISLGKWIDQNGKERHLQELKGKVIVWSSVYTTCPFGCTGVADEMKKLRDEFGSNSRFHLISLSIYPEHDRPEFLKQWAEKQGFGGDNWWFLTSPTGTPEEGDTVRKWIERNFRIKPVRKDPEHIAKFPADVWDHPLVMVLTDPKGDVRTPTDNDWFWYPFHIAYDNKWFPRPIREDVKKLLEEAENAE